jgi:hypothetical protein
VRILGTRSAKNGRECMHGSLVPAAETSKTIMLRRMNGNNRNLISDAVIIIGNSSISVDLVTMTIGDAVEEQLRIENRIAMVRVAD